MRSTIRIALTAGLLALTACGDQSTAPDEIPAGEPQSIPASTIMLQLSRLADDSMAGRGSTSNDELRAANYIRKEFQLTGLQVPSSGALQSFPVGTATSQNVIGILPGRGKLQDEWIVVGAHYDHIGVINGDIYNGADDNASGTSAVMAIAAQLARYVSSGSAGTVARRSVMFIAFGAEERGLVGSNYYCAHPYVPLMSVYAMINFDMIGRLVDSVYVGGLTLTPSWNGVLQRYNTDGLRTTNASLSGRTDYVCFANAQRPVLWFFTGLHADYHRPTDDVALINQNGLERITNLAHRIIVYLALTDAAL